MKKRIIYSATALCLIILSPGCSKDNTSNGKQWHDLGSSDVGYSIVTLCSDPAGNIYAASFIDENGQYFVAKWNGTTWGKVGNLTSKYCIYHLCSDLSGNIYASGIVDNTETYNYVAKWDGTSWTDLGLHSSFTWDIKSVTDKNGNLFGTSFNGRGEDVFAYAGGNSWSNLGSIDPNKSINSICSDGNGKVYEMLYGGTLYAPVIAVHQNDVWEELPSLTTNTDNDISASCTDASGNLYVAGHLYDNTTKKFYAGKWDGNNWTKLPLSGTVQCMCVDPQGNLYVAGSISFGTGFDVAKWDGSKWVGLGLGSKISNPAICSDPTGAIYVKGTFNTNYINLIRVYK